MSLQPKPKMMKFSPIVRAKHRFSEGNKEGAVALLIEEATKENVMACYDAGLMIFQGIGWERDCDLGLELMRMGVKYEKDQNDMSWKDDGSVSEVIGPLSMNLYGKDVSGYVLKMLSSAFRVNSSITKLDLG